MHAQETALGGQDFLRIGDVTAGQLTALLDRAAQMRRNPTAFTRLLEGESVACYFEKPSTRTRVSFEVACHRLGALPIMLRPDELQLGRGEPIADTARVLSGYCCAIVARVFAQATLEAMAEAATVPVVNALSDAHHPCQALADLLTIRDRLGALAGIRLAYVGDANNVARSLAEAAALSGMEVVVATPPERVAPGMFDDAMLGAGLHGGSFALVPSAADAVAGAHVVYTDVWVSMGDEDDRAARVARLEPFRITQALMAAADDEAIFLHCLPAHRGEEVAADVIDGPRSVVFAQAANRLPTEQALLHALVTGHAAPEP